MYFLFQLVYRLSCLVFSTLSRLKEYKKGSENGLIRMVSVLKKNITSHFLQVNACRHGTYSICNADALRRTFIKGTLHPFLA
jgi:hypothetical protein